MKTQMVPIDEIRVDRERRQRRLIKSRPLEELADSIKRLGLINPITLDAQFQLIAGERRLEACKVLGLHEIAAQFLDDLDPIKRHLIELEENIKREDLSWQDRHDAMMEYYRLRRESEPAITMEKIGDAIGTARTSLSDHVLVERYRDAPTVKQADNFKEAWNAARRLDDRVRADEGYALASPADIHTPEVLNADFTEWAASYDGSKFNLLHCDFPYGINQQTSDQAAVGALGAYDDSPDVYWNLLRTLTVNLDNICADSAHIIFWLSANIEIASRTWELLKLLDGFRFDEVPLVWVKDDNKGIVPDAQRRPRRGYEIAYFGWRGDRKLIRTFNNVASAPTTRSRHPHEKSELALSHFFSGIVDAQTRLLDPTCGSGAALRAAKALGAAVFGIERNKEFADVARRALRSDQPSETLHDASLGG